MSPPCRSISTSAGAISSSKTWCASTSLNVPSAEPGKQRLRFLPSSGTTNAVRARKDVMLTIGTAVIRPESALVSSSFMKRTTAAIDEYSPPWMPAIRQRCGPSAAPRASKHGSSSPASTSASKRIVRRSISAARPSTSTSGTWLGGRSRPREVAGGRRARGAALPSGGSSVEQSGSWAIGQRGWNRQPLGTAIGLGGSPTTAGGRRPARAEPDVGTALQQALRVRVSRIREQLVRRRDLDDPAQVHHRHAVADVANDGHVVRDEQHRQPEPRPQVLEQVEHRRLHRDVECRDRLVGDEQVGLERERPRDADPLPLAARELPRVRVERARAEADELEQLLGSGRRPRPPGPSRGTSAARRAPAAPSCAG